MKRALVLFAFAAGVAAAADTFVLLYATASGALGSVPFTNQPIAIEVFFNASQITGSVGSQSTAVLPGSSTNALGRSLTGLVQLVANGNTLTFTQVGGSSFTLTNPAFASRDLAATGYGGSVTAPPAITSTTSAGALTFSTNGGTLSIAAGSVFTLGGCAALKSGGCSGPGVGGTTVTVTTLFPIAVTNKTVEVDTFLTRLTANLNGGSSVYDQSFNVAFSDSTVQAAVNAARTAMTSAAGSAPVTVTGPTQTANTKTLTNTSTQTVDGAPVLSTDPAAGNTIGPAFILYGDSESTGFLVAAGNINTDVLQLQTIPRTVTTTNTYQVAQTYALAGTTTQLPATPVPPSLLLALTGLAGVGLHEIRRRREGQTPRGI